MPAEVFRIRRLAVRVELCLLFPKTGSNGCVQPTCGLVSENPIRIADYGHTADLINLLLDMGEALDHQRAIEAEPTRAAALDNEPMQAIVSVRTLDRKREIQEALGRAEVPR